MFQNVEDMQKLAKDNMDLAAENFASVSKSMQAIALEASDFAKKSFEDGTKAAEQVLGAKSLDKMVEAQTDYAKNAYEAYVAEMTKMNEMIVDLSKDMYSPFEKAFAQVSK